MSGIGLLQVFGDQRSLILMSKSVSNPESSKTPGGPLFPPRQYSERLNENCGIIPWSITLDVRVLHDCVCVGMSLVFICVSRSCTLRQTLVSEWKSRETSVDMFVMSPNSFSQITDALRSEINYSLYSSAVQLLQKCTMTGSHPSRFFFFWTWPEFQVHGRGCTSYEKLIVFTFFLCISCPSARSFIFSCTRLITVSTGHPFRSPWEPNKLYTSLRKRNETCTFFI